MKLYTKEQVTNVWQKYWLTSGVSNELERLLEQEKSIEIPSDEEIEKKAESFYPISKEYKEKYKTDYDDFNTCWQEGVKWMKEQITKTK